MYTYMILSIEGQPLPAVIASCLPPRPRPSLQKQVMFPLQAHWFQIEVQVLRCFGYVCKFPSSHDATFRHLWWRWGSCLRLFRVALRIWSLGFSQLGNGPKLGKPEQLEFGTATAGPPRGDCRQFDWWSNDVLWCSKLPSKSHLWGGSNRSDLNPLKQAS